MRRFGDQPGFFQTGLDRDLSGALEYLNARLSQRIANQNTRHDSPNDVIMEEDVVCKCSNVASLKAKNSGKEISMPQSNIRVPVFVNPSPADSREIQYARVSLPLARGDFKDKPAISVKDDHGKGVPVQ